MYDLFWLLLPVAAFSGWLVGSRQGTGQRQDRTSGFSNRYYEGLNYLLNEQPDKAVNVFVEMLDVNNETVELHLALGTLFRRRGEVDRSIRIHQNLIARPTLPKHQKEQALLELGQDYLAAGLLDRAERLFQELQTSKQFSQQAWRFLVDVYQQEKDWENAIAAARQYEKMSNSRLAAIIAQYYCQMAEELIANNERGSAQKLIKKALLEDPKCVRASLLEADVYRHDQQYSNAIKSLMRVIDQDENFFTEVIDPLLECYEKLNDPRALQGLMGRLVSVIKGSSSALAFARLLRREQGVKTALEFVERQIDERPTLKGLQRYLELVEVDEGASCTHMVEKTSDTVSRLLQQGAEYKCERCGFSGHVLYWQCPSCKSWGSVKPL